MTFYGAVDAPKTRRGRNTLCFLFSAACLGTLLAGCGGGTSNSSAQVRSLNAYIPATGVDGSIVVTTGGAPITGAGNLGFGFANSAQYTAVPSGTFSANLSIPAISAVIPYQTTLNAVNYTLVVEGEQGQTGTLAPQLLVFPNYTVNQISIPSGSAAVRVVNVSLNANPIGLYSTTSGTPSAALATGLGNIPYGYNSATNVYVAVPTAQIANLAIVDTTSPGNALGIANTSNLTNSPPTFSSGQAWTLFVYGQPNNTAQPLTATWIQDN